jgi:hypothetical protein
MYKVYSSVFLSYDVDNYTCYINQTEYNKLQDLYNSRKMFARIQKKDLFWICSLGAPISEEYNSIYVPMWMLEQIDAHGDGEELIVDFMPCEIFDMTTKITLQAWDSTLQSENIQEVLSNELTKLGIIKKDTIIYIYNYEINKEVPYNVIDIEPASVSLCEGNEVSLEFIESLDSIGRSATPYPIDTLPEILAPEIITPEVPVPSVGGVKREGRFNPWRNKDFKPPIS